MIKLDTLLRFPGEETIEREVWFLLNTLSKTWKRRIEEGINKKEPELEDSENFQHIHIVGGGGNEREDFAGGQVVNNLPYKKKKKESAFKYREDRFNPWSGN